MKHRHLFISYFKFIVFWLILIILLWYTQEVLKQKFINDSTSIVNGFYACDEELDTVFIGPSSTFCTIMPNILREEYGVDTYVMGSSAQTLDLSYLYLQEVLKYQNPQTIVLDVSRIKFPEGIERNDEQAKRWAFTDLRLSFSKIVAIYNSCNGINEDFWTYVFPVLRYKSRFNELTKLDFTYAFSDKINLTGGYVESSVTAKDEISLCYIDKNNNDGYFDVHPNDISALNKIVELCNRKAIRLVLFKSPVDKENWGTEYFNTVNEFARNNNLLYIDCGTDINKIGLDAMTDFRDKAHCNNSGAKKVTIYVGKILY